MGFGSRLVRATRVASSGGQSGRVGSGRGGGARGRSSTARRGQAVQRGGRRHELHLHTRHRGRAEQAGVGEHGGWDGRATGRRAPCGRAQCPPCRGTCSRGNGFEGDRACSEQARGTAEGRQAGQAQRTYELAVTPMASERRPARGRDRLPGSFPLISDWRRIAAVGAHHKSFLSHLFSSFASYLRGRTRPPVDLIA